MEMTVDNLLFSHLYFYILQDYYENKHRTPWTYPEISEWSIVWQPSFIALSYI